MGESTVAIIGSGIAGATIAYLLTKQGYDVTIFEKGPDYPYPHTTQFEERVLYDYANPAYRLPDDLRGLTASGTYKRDFAGERIMLEAPSAGAADTDRIARRMGALRRMLEDQGISVAVAPPAAPGALGPDQIRLVAMRATAVDPDCPGYNEPVTSYDRFGRPNLAIGCSNEINLGLMIADPNDLVRGRPLAPADAERSALAVQKYRTGSDGEEGGQGGASTMSILPLAIGSGTGGGTQ